MNADDIRKLAEAYALSDMKPGRLSLVLLACADVVEATSYDKDMVSLQHHPIAKHGICPTCEALVKLDEIKP